MSKFRCTCGYLLGFNIAPCRYDANVLRQQDADTVDNKIIRAVTEYLAFVAEGRRNEWFQQFYGEVFALEDASVISDIFSRYQNDFFLALHQCEQCGRLWLQEKPGGNVYHSYLPEGPWRGALEAHPTDFVGYVDGQDFFGASIEEVQQVRDEICVTLKRGATESSLVTFSGVSALRQYERERREVRFLSEWKDIPPLRRFIFDSTDQSSRPLLEITAQEVHLDRQNGMTLR